MYASNQAPVEYDFGGSRARVLVPGASTGNAWCLLEIFSPAGRATPLHRHEREDETLVVLEGALDVTVDGRHHRLLPGESIVLPRGTAHTFRNPTADTARYLVICTPAGFDGFVDACAIAKAAPFEPSIPTDADKARMRAAAERFGIALNPC
jgi:quercetin dioxygenase-like cupin family protein